MNADAQDTIDGLPTHLAKQWVLALESDGSIKELDLALEYLLRTLLSYAMADYAMMAEPSREFTERFLEQRGSDKWSLGHYAGALRDLLNQVVHSDRDDLFFAPLVDWYFDPRSRKKKPPQSNEAKVMDALVTIRNKAHHGSEHTRFDPKLAEQYRTDLTAVMDSVSRWMRRYPLFVIRKKVNNPGGGYSGDVVWYQGRNRSKATGNLWTAEQLEQGASAIVSKLNQDGSREVLFLDFLIQVQKERMADAFFLIESIGRKGELRFSASNGERWEHTARLDELSLKLVNEQKWVDSFSPQKRSPHIQYRDVFTRLLLDDGRIDRFDRKGLAEIGLTDNECVDVERHVLSIEVPRALGCSPTEGEQPAIHALLNAEPATRELVDAALEEFEKLQTGGHIALAMNRSPEPPRRWPLFGAAALLAVTAAAWFGMPDQGNPCGNGAIDPGEECDDGNAWGGDLCTEDCLSNVAMLPGGSIEKGFTETALTNREYALSPSRKPDTVLEDVARWATPSTLVQFSGFQIMKTEVSWGAVRMFASAADDGHVDALNAPDESLAWYRKTMAESRKRMGDQPGGQRSDGTPADLTLRDAIAVCAYFGGTLPTEEQWEYAARGQGGQRSFPWGNRAPQTSPDDCELMTGYFHASLNPPIDFNCGGRKVVEVGSLPEGCTPEGVCEMAGNESEFVLPGAVIWKAVDDDPKPDEPTMVAFHPGIFERDGIPEFLRDCSGNQLNDPYGMVSGTLTDCVMFASAGAPPIEQHSHPSAGVRAIVKGGNADDSLPVFYQPRARYNRLGPDHQSGARCVIHRSL